MDFVCGVCGQAHDILPSLGFRAPAAWMEADEEERALEFNLNEDFCAHRNERFFIRCCLVIPVLDSETHRFEFGVWARLGTEDFWRYMATINAIDQSGLPPMAAWLSNPVNGYPDTQGLTGRILARGDRLRPLLELDDGDHPLAVQQREGVTFDHVTRFMHALGGL